MCIVNVHVCVCSVYIGYMCMMNEFEVVYVRYKRMSVVWYVVLSCYW